MPRGAIKPKSSDVWGEDLLVSTLPQFLQKKLLHLMSDNCPVRSPHHESLTHLVIDQEQVQLLAQLPMVALQGFLLSLKTGL